MDEQPYLGYSGAELRQLRKEAQGRADSTHKTLTYHKVQTKDPDEIAGARQRWQQLTAQVADIDREIDRRRERRRAKEERRRQRPT